MRGLLTANVALVFPPGNDHTSHPKTLLNMIFLFPRWDMLVPLMAFFLLFEYSVVVFPQVFCALEASPRESWNIIGILGPWRLCHLAATW